MNSWTTFLEKFVNKSLEFKYIYNGDSGVIFEKYKLNSWSYVKLNSWKSFLVNYSTKKWRILAKNFGVMVVESFGQLSELVFKGNFEKKT